MKIIAILISSLAVGCTSTTTYYVVPLKAAPKGIEKSDKKVAQKKTTQKKVAVYNGPQRTNALVQILDIGPTVDDAGNYVAPHKYYKIVKTEAWSFGAPKTAPTFVKEGSPTDQLNKAIAKANEAAKRAEDAANALQTKVAQQPEMPVVNDPSGIHQYMHPQDDDTALQKFNQDVPQQ